MEDMDSLMVSALVSKPLATYAWMFIVRGGESQRNMYRNGGREPEKNLENLQVRLENFG